MKKAKRPALRWAVYWLVILGIYLAASAVFGNYAMYLPIPALAAVHFALRLALEAPVSRLKSPGLKKGLTLAARLAAIGVAAAICLLMVESGSNYNQAYIDSLDYSVFSCQSQVSYRSEDGVYTVRAGGEELKILQLTDIHLCGSITTIGTDRKTIDACYAMIRQAQPDLIIVTGDLVYPIPIWTFSRNNLKPFYQLCRFMDHVGIPWALVYGNHDTEMVAGYDEKALASICRHFQQEENSPLLYAEKQPDIYGRYNQYLRLENQDGSLNRLAFLIDSNDYVKGTAEVNDYDSVHPDQIQWYADTIDRVSAQEGGLVRSFVFQHIPFQEFAGAQAALAAGAPEAVHLFGKNEEEVCCPAQNSGFFDVMLEKQSTDAVFVGHDHVNYAGVRYRGIDLVYGKSIDYIAYPGIAQRTAQRGATLTSLDRAGGYTIRQLDYSR